MLHFSETAPFPCTPTPREQGKARPQNKKEQPVGLHFDFARRLPQSYILKLLDRVRGGALRIIPNIRKSRPGAACYGKVKRRNSPDRFQNQSWFRQHFGQRPELRVDPSIGADGLSQNRERT